MNMNYYSRGSNLGNAGEPGMNRFDDGGFGFNNSPGPGREIEDLRRSMGANENYGGRDD